MRFKLSGLACLGLFLHMLPVYAGPPNIAGTPAGDAAPLTEITLKKSFWTGWKYSLDGEKYESVGITGTSLSLAMEGSTRALDEMKSYRSKKILSTIIDGTGSGLATWSVIDWAVGDDDWDNTNSILLGVGLGLSVAGSVIDAVATSHLKQAVLIFNGKSSAWSLGLNGSMWAVRDANPVTLSMRVTF